MKVDERRERGGGKGWCISRLSSRIVESSDTCPAAGGVGPTHRRRERNDNRAGERAPMNRPLFDPTLLRIFNASTPVEFGTARQARFTFGHSRMKSDRGERAEFY